jgi:hypothetical protein
MVTLHFVPYTDIEQLSSVGRIRKLLNIAKENKIVMLEGRLKDEEEAELIKVTMEEINKEFKGIELAVIEPKLNQLNALQKVRQGLASALLGNRTGMTVIGPANVVKQIKKNPNSIELLTADKRRR